MDHQQTWIGKFLVQCDWVQLCNSLVQWSKVKDHDEWQLLMTAAKPVKASSR